MKSFLPGALLGLAAALFVIFVHPFDASAPAPIAPPATVETAPVPTIVPLPAEKPAEHPAAVPTRPHRHAPPHKAVAAPAAPPAPLPWSCATIRFWTSVLPKASIASLANEHHVTTQQRAQAAHCFTT
jgi:hypothetical protein